MSIKTILVALNDLRRLDDIADIACRLAVANEAHLTGVFVVPTMPVYPVPGAYVLPELIETHRATCLERAQKARGLFDAVTARHGLTGEWRLVEDGASIMANAVIRHGHQADLLVIGQVDPDNNDGIESDFADRVVMETGRPVIVVPCRGRFDDIGHRVLAGWNATPHAARAIFDSMPVAAAARQVWLVWIDPRSDPDLAGDFPGSELAASLSRQGIKVTTEALARADTTVAQALLARAADHDADLIVIGAYGHSRLNEFVFGGVTRELLRDMTVPVLMSH